MKQKILGLLLMCPFMGLVAYAYPMTSIVYGAVFSFLVGLWLISFTYFEENDDE